MRAICELRMLMLLKSAPPSEARLPLASVVTTLRNLRDFYEAWMDLGVRESVLRWKRVRVHGGPSSQPQRSAVLNRRTAGARAVARFSGSLRAGDRESGRRAGGRHAPPHTSDGTSNAGTRRLDWCIFPNPRTPNPRAHRRRQ